jgi:hypothetical protein
MITVMKHHGFDVESRPEAGVVVGERRTNGS